MYVPYCRETTPRQAQDLRVRIYNAILQNNAQSPGSPALRVGIGMGVSGGNKTALPAGQAGLPLRDQADAQLCEYKQSRPAVKSPKSQSKP